ncbi:MAG: hypothetical protein M1816_004338 [Peltula sp. TS41687]|nr:MAG: hypothetical protein M1816_004338 [Peltula sp. TS41687]
MDGSFEDHHHQSNSGSFGWTPRPLTNDPGITDSPNDRDLPPTSKAEPKSLSSPPTRPSLDSDSLPGARKSLSGISLRAFLLGQVCSVGVLLTAYLLYTQQPLWRVPFFFSLLSLFHFLEFWITARFNTRYATVSAFLLSSNGTAYNLAQLSAVVECVTTNLFFHDSVWFKFSASWSIWLTVVGIMMTAVGQTTRSLAMAHAGTNFNHRVQTKRSDEHQLVKTGIYAYLRHPSYFGFFWWALGAQVVLGNKICFVAYALVLWKFFSDRIKKEEEFLVRFFGQEYLDYRRRTGVGIPFIK